MRTIEGFQNYKQRGEWVELLFMTAAARRGFNVSKPWGDSARYDVSLEHNGRFARVQIKSTDRWNGSGYSCTLHAYHQRAYTELQIEYFAIYIIPEELWYVFPASKLMGKTAVILTPRSRDHKYQRYKEAWDLFRNRARRRPELPLSIKTRLPRRRKITSPQEPSNGEPAASE